MLHQHLIPLEEKETWNRILDGIPHGTAHTHAYNKAIAHTHPEPIVLYHSWDDEGFETICPLKIRNFEGHLDVTTPYGLSGFSSIGDLPSFEMQWRQFCKIEGWVCGYVAQHPEFKTPILNLGDMGRTSIFCHLGDPKEMAKKLHPTHRYDVRKLEENVDVIINDPSVLAALPILYKSTLALTQASPLYNFKDRTLEVLSALPGSICLGARRGDTILAIALFLSNGTQADYFCSAYMPEGRKYSKLLVWRALQHLASIGLDSVNLGGGVQEGDSLEQFKRRFGGHPLKTMNYKLIFDDVVYQKLSEETPESGYFPAYMG
jgi:Acetyltransferase (GNAT) domain